VLADAENLPFPDGDFDVVLSSIGAMFAPDQRRTAAELLRVCRPGGRVGMINWTPDGSIGDFFDLFGRYGPPVDGPEPTLWGTEDHVRAMFGDGVDELTVTHDRLVVDRFASPLEYRDYYREMFGPVVAVYDYLDDAGRAALDRDFLAYAQRFFDDGRYYYEYLLVVATRR
jgi:SAM-dependent methyltransferase